MVSKEEPAAVLVDAKDAAKMLSVSPRKLWALTFEDEIGLPYVRLGRCVRYPVDDLLQWIDAQKKGGTQ